MEVNNAVHNRAGPSGHSAFGIHSGLRPAPITKVLTDTQLRRRKKQSAALSITGATIGLAALGSKGGGAVLRRTVKPAGEGRRLAAKLDSHTTGLLTAGAGIGGVGGYNSASIARAEAKRPLPGSKPIKKDWSAFDQKRTKKVDPLVRHYGLTGDPPDTLAHDKRTELWQARDKRLNQKRDRWDKTSHGLHATQRGGEATVGAVGAGLGAMSLRDAWEDEHPGSVGRFAVRHGKTIQRASTAHANFKMLAIGGAGAVAAAGAKQAKKVADRKTRKYSTREGGTASAAVQRLKKSDTMSAFGVEHG